MNTQISFEQLFSEYHKPLLYFVKKMVCDTDAAEDIVVETFLKFDKLKDYKNPVRTLFLFAKRSCINYNLNKERHNKTLNEVVNTAPEIIEGKIIESLLLKQIYDSFEKLSGIYKVVLKKYYLEVKTIEQIAEDTGKSPHTIRNVKAIAVSKLKEILK